MKEYTVTYSINILAETPQNAAEEVEKILVKPTYRPHLRVKDDSSGTQYEIDLQDRI